MIPNHTERTPIAMKMLIKNRALFLFVFCIMFACTAHTLVGMQARQPLVTIQHKKKPAVKNPTAQEIATTALFCREVSEAARIATETAQKYKLNDKIPATLLKKTAPKPQGGFRPSRETKLEPLALPNKPEPIAPEIIDDNQDKQNYGTDTTAKQPSVQLYCKKSDTVITIPRLNLDPQNIRECTKLERKRQTYLALQEWENSLDL